MYLLLPNIQDYLKISKIFTCSSPILKTILKQLKYLQLLLLNIQDYLKTVNAPNFTQSRLRFSPIHINADTFCVFWKDIQDLNKKQR